MGSLVASWLRFLEALEDLAEREAATNGEIYHRGPRHKLLAIALDAAEHGREPPALPKR